MSDTLQKAEERLLHAIGAARVSHAFFLASLDPEPARQLAERIAALICVGEMDAARLAESANFRAYEGAAMRMDDVRELIASLAQSPLDGRLRCILIADAHHMSANVQNALLKTLEEPPASTVFMLIGNIAGVLPTIASRCAILRLGFSSAQEIEPLLRSHGATPSAAKLYAAAGGGSRTRSFRLEEDEAFCALRLDSFATLTALLRGALPLSASKKLCANRNAADALSFMLSFLRDMLLLRARYSAALENPDQRDAIAALAARFTIGRITCMIEMLSKAMNELYAPGASLLTDLAVMDKLFLELSEAISNQ